MNNHLARSNSTFKTKQNFHIMKLTTINTGFFKLDGGAMFGVVPKSMWNKLNPADANNMCTWAMRCLLIEDGKKSEAYEEAKKHAGEKVAITGTVTEKGGVQAIIVSEVKAKM